MNTLPDDEKINVIQDKTELTPYPELMPPGIEDPTRAERFPKMEQPLFIPQKVIDGYMDYHALVNWFESHDNCALFIDPSIEVMRKTGINTNSAGFRLLGALERFIRITENQH